MAKPSVCSTDRQEEMIDFKSASDSDFRETVSAFVRYSDLKRAERALLSESKSGPNCGRRDWLACIQAAKKRTAWEVDKASGIDDLRARARRCFNFAAMTALRDALVDEDAFPDVEAIRVLDDCIGDLLNGFRSPGTDYTAEEKERLVRGIPRKCARPRRLVEAQQKLYDALLEREASIVHQVEAQFGDRDHLVIIPLHEPTWRGEERRVFLAFLAHFERFSDEYKEALYQNRRTVEAKRAYLEKTGRRIYRGWKPKGLEALPGSLLSMHFFQLAHHVSRPSLSDFVSPEDDDDEREGVEERPDPEEVYAGFLP